MTRRRVFILAAGAAVPRRGARKPGGAAAGPCRGAGQVAPRPASTAGAMTGFGVRRRVAAFLRRDRSRRFKARTSPRTPNQGITSAGSTLTFQGREASFNSCLCASENSCWCSRSCFPRARTGPHCKPSRGPRCWRTISATIRLRMQSAKLSTANIRVRCAERLPPPKRPRRNQQPFRPR